MAVSGSVDFNRTRTQIVTEALELLNVVGANEVVSNSDMTLGSNRLNAMVKSWQAEGLHLWGKQEGVVFLENGVNTYDLSSAVTSAHSCNIDDLVVTTISADEATAQTTISVTSSTGMAVDDYIGIELDSGDMHWSTIGSVPGSTSVVIDDALPSAASSTNRVYSYTSKVNRPLRVLSVRLVTGSGTTQYEYNLMSYSHEKYYLITNKNQESPQPTCYLYDPQLLAGRLSLWTTPNDVSKYLRITYERSLDDFDNAIDTPDFPQEWLEALTYNLAYRLAPAFGKTGYVLDDIRALAQLTKEAASSFDREMSSIRMMRADED